MVCVCDYVRVCVCVCVCVLKVLWVLLFQLISILLDLSVYTLHFQTFSI